MSLIGFKIIMSNILNRFTNKTVGTDNKIFDYIPKITSSKDFQQIKDIDVIISSWNNILMTPKRSFLHDPEYGSDLYKLIFEPMDDITIEQIKNEIINSISYYDTRAIILNINILENTLKNGYVVEIELKYEGETKTMTLEFVDTVVLNNE
jgi:phage baseplate assembly protein W